MECNMKQYILIMIVFLFVITATSLGQQFIQKWEIAERLYYVGDIDGDGIGEFVSFDEDNLITKFYDAQSRDVKWTITGKRFDYEMFLGEHATSNPSYIIFPSIDYNGDGKREVFFIPANEKGIIITDVVNNTNIFEWN